MATAQQPAATVVRVDIDAFWGGRDDDHGARIHAELVPKNGAAVLTGQTRDQGKVALLPARVVPWPDVLVLANAVDAPASPRINLADAGLGQRWTLAALRESLASPEDRKALSASQTTLSPGQEAAVTQLLGDPGAIADAITRSMDSPWDTGEEDPSEEWRVTVTMANGQRHVATSTSSHRFALPWHTASGAVTWSSAIGRSLASLHLPLAVTTSWSEEPTLKEATSDLAAGLNATLGDIRAHEMAQSQLALLETHFIVVGPFYYPAGGYDNATVQGAIKSRTGPANLSTHFVIDLGPKGAAGLAHAIPLVESAFAAIGRSPLLSREIASHPESGYGVNAWQGDDSDAVAIDDFILDMKRLHHPFHLDNADAAKRDTIQVATKGDVDWLLFSDGRVVQWHYGGDKPRRATDVECAQDEPLWCAGEVFDASGKDITEVSAVAEPGTPVGRDYLDQCRGSGQFVNAWYGFQATFPKSFRCFRNSPIGLSDHGTEMAIDKSNDRTISLYAGYNATFSKRPSEDSDATIDYMKHEDSIEHVRVVAQHATTLGGLNAERTVIRYRMKATGVERVSDETTALRRIGRASKDYTHAYSVTLDTPWTHYRTDRRTLERLLSTWRPIRSYDSPAVGTDSAATAGSPQRPSPAKPAPTQSTQKNGAPQGTPLF